MSGGAGRSFARAKAMFAAVMSVMQQALQPLQQQMALQALGTYESRGKGGKRPHSKGNGSVAVRRAALKRRNQQRHRAACRG